MADAKVVLETLLRSNASAIYSLLENVKHSQMLQDKSSALEWIAASNKLLNSHKDRWMGVCLLDSLVEQCGTELFSENCLPWLKTLIQILQQEKQNVCVCNYVADMLEKIISFSAQISEISRQVSLTVIPSLFALVLNEKTINLEVSLSVVKTCIQHYPGASGSFVKRIESLLLQVFNSDNYFLIQSACSCFAILPKCGNTSGTGSDKQTIAWETQWMKLLSALSTVIHELYSEYETDPSYRMESETFQLKTIPVVEPQRTETCVLRIKFLFKCLDLMLRNELSKSVNVPLNCTIKIIRGILAVNEKSVNNVAVESILLKCSIPAIHLSAIEFLSTLVLKCGMSVLPYHHIIIRMLLSELSWSECDDKIHGLQHKYSQLRSATYDCVQYLVHMTSSVGENNEKIRKIIHHVMEDIKPRVTKTKLLAPTVSTSKTTHGKAKRKRMQDDVSQLNQIEQKTDYDVNRELCLSGLQALNTLILNGGNDIPSDIIQELQEFIVTLLQECQTVSPTQSYYPIPYGSPDCRKMLYNLLQTLLYNHQPKSPPPLQHAILLFSRGTQDRDFEVSKFCTEAQMMCHVLIHPRVAIISSSFTNNVAQNNTNINNLQENIELNVGTDQPIMKTNEQLEKDSRDENREQIVEKTGNAVHITFSSTEDHITQVTSKGSSAIDKDTTLSDAEKTRNCSLEELRKSQNDHDEIIHTVVNDNENEKVVEGKTIAKQFDNVKRSLPESFEESTNMNECLSEAVGDSISTVKRRKTQEISTNSNNVEENVSNSNKETAKTDRGELLESGEDDTLAQEMINSFVNSVPD
ncbi:proline-, glutamic acid- and leucine-rich protein 1-like [Dendronephthya gigantea]|uniref:proline-, glutamic acid- and leucine-rich protein 1-like n=1 Tax=Dendronephthya gigantea TaxID=151771 RepID=UPI00106B1458|nr:proline-, glutamic acid- and leucine-rich protein 1-like [Dendronephthya gigantea]